MGLVLLLLAAVERVEKWMGLRGVTPGSYPDPLHCSELGLA